MVEEGRGDDVNVMVDDEDGCAGGWPVVGLWVAPPSSAAMGDIV